MLTGSKSAIILAGGCSSRFGEDKALLLLAEKTLIERVHERLLDVVDEIVVSVSTEAQKRSYLQLLNDCLIVTENRFHGGPLAGLYTGLKTVSGNRVAVVGCDMPFISGNLLKLLFELCLGYDAAIPRWPSGYIEPLHSVYDSSSCLGATEKALATGRVDMRAMISHLRDVKYFPTETIQELESDLTMFVNINTQSDLEKAGHILQSALARESSNNHYGSMPDPAQKLP